ncbi:uncharacterized protein RCC_10422 [Ramularia collo-cygni]|uniref:DUF1279 domain-containing protein n=1 Tax=Ramularia collo-cygni TaxID=112498 RepID=A0A2D3VFL1_9PEZI|nr:uncharacterized protein RCC_10422 [Ramularia collo-cygni]CZT24695.1 uncharacterized protein RCC_10422 [Ramularia collo-cygni]
MLKSPRLLQLLRQVPAQEGFLKASLRRDFTGLVSKPQAKTGSFQRRDFVTAKLRTARPAHSKAWRRQTRQNSSNASRNEPGGQEPQSLSDRMRAMSRKYGWTVVGIYLGLSALDFPFCFLAVRWLGTDRIAAAEHAVVSRFWAVLESVVPSLKERRAQNQLAEAEDAVKEASEAVEKDAKHEPASIWTQLLLAYGVHKSLFFLRVPLTLAVTPKVVKTLRGWGFQIGKPKPK